MVVRGPGLNCRRCSSVMGMPLKPRSTRRSRSSWAAVVLAESPPVFSPAASPSAPDGPSPSGKSALDVPWIWAWLSASAMEIMSARGLWILKGPSSGSSPACVRSEPQLVMWASRFRSSLALVVE
ncbi:hypothetical protein EYF80_035712 [Liparis tanakae]|uniref:Uncharacterized protein n=1 Tax=Liparis tanakae TaxID=230148 RepID=A0A4Z2GLI7_9TELE|nr:hypothetical protein EYF80_035712 [Liparis tanakae]